MKKMPHKLRSSEISNTTPHIKPTFFPSENKFIYLYFIRNLWFNNHLQFTAAATSAALVDAVLVTAFCNIYTKCTLTYIRITGPRTVKNATGV